MRWYIGCAGVALVIAAVACKSGGASPSGIGPPCTNDATQEAGIQTSVSVDTAIAEGLATATAMAYYPDDEINCRLRRAILTEADLTGWIRDPDFSHDGPIQEPDTQVGPCRTPKPQAYAWLEAIFNRASDATAIPTDGGPILDHRVWAMEPGGAAAFIDALKRNCGSSPTNPPISGLRPANAPPVGDDSYALQQSDPAGGRGREIFFSDGDILEQISLSNDEGELDGIAATAAAKVSKVGVMPTPSPQVGETCHDEENPPLDVTMALSAGLLTADDLPATLHSHGPFGPQDVSIGWIVLPPGRCYDAVFCGDEAAPQPGLVASVGRSYDSYLEFVLNDVYLFKEATADDYMRSLSRANESVRSCKGTLDGNPVTWTYRPVALAAPGDDAVAWRVATEGYAGGSSPASYFIAVVRRDKVVSMLTIPFNSFGSDPLAGVGADGVALLSDLVDHTRARLASLPAATD
jgi:hypothetical protein